MGCVPHRNCSPLNGGVRIARHDEDMNFENAKVGEAALRLMDEVAEGEVVEDVYVVAAARTPDGNLVVRMAPSSGLQKPVAIGMITMALDNLRSGPR
ncbi:MAG: hypothetical protein JWM90_2239 [Thermoleophilia bacterium]|nr:hypothetical protein [Thermoleophilia bacterium]